MEAVTREFMNLSPAFLRRVELPPSSPGNGSADFIAQDSAGPLARAGFFLSTPAWLELHTSMSNIFAFARQLEHVDEREGFGGGLRQVAADALNAVKVWERDIFLPTVAAAGRIAEFGWHASQSYPKIEGWVQELSNGEQVPFLKQELEQNLKLARTAQSESDILWKALEQFNTTCSNLQTKFDILLQQYTDNMTTTTPAIAQLQSELQAARDRLEEHNRRYHEYCTAANNTLYYAWIPIAGWIAGGIVGIDNAKKAQDAQAAAAQESRRIAEISVRLDDKVRNFEYLRGTTRMLGALTPNFRIITPLIGQMRSIWDALSSDLGALVIGITKDMPKERVFMLRMALREAAKEWERIADEAESYLSTATTNFAATT
jgi:hypothetical protein